MSGACIQRCIVRNVFFYSTFTNVLYSCHVFNVFDILKFFLERFLHLCQKLGRGITPPPLMRHLALLIDNISMFLCLSSGNQGGYSGKMSRRENVRIEWSPVTGGAHDGPHKMKLRPEVNDKGTARRRAVCI